MAQRTAIVLSAGYLGFYAHAGFMLAVEELGIDYCAIAGSSAGAIVAALHASGVPARDIADLLLGIRKRDVWDSPGLRGFLGALARRGRGWTGLLRGDRFERLVEQSLGAKRFEDCHRPLYVTALNLQTGKDETFYTGPIADKVRASCSYPFLMSPKKLNEALYWDGGFLSKIPLEVMLARERPDSVVIHYLPTRAAVGDVAADRWSALTMLEVALTAARREIETHRLNALNGSPIRIARVEPDVPRVSLKDLSAGKAAIETAYRHALSQLASCR